MHYINNQLYIDSVNVTQIIKQFGTPVYVYSKKKIESNWETIQNTLSKEWSCPIVAYAVKANSHLAILHLLAQKGAYFDVVSGGELQRVLLAGKDIPGIAQKIFFSGVGKTEKELVEAIRLSIGGIHVESAEELARIEKLALDLNVSKASVNIALRINPDVNPKTHPYIATGLKENKFGMALSQAQHLYQTRADYPHLCFSGLTCHIGSQIFEQASYVEALQSLVKLYDTLAEEGLPLEYIDMGGGFGVTYTDEAPLDFAALVHKMAQVTEKRPLKMMVEPGRAVVGNAGILLTSIEYLKHNEAKQFLIVDAGMNDLLRPALYEAVHPIWPVRKPLTDEEKIYDVVGPICETGDCLGRARKLPASLKSGDYLAIGVVGAYGFSMSSHYNTRPKPAEVLVDEDKFYLIRPRETFEELIRGEISDPNHLPM